MMGLNYSTVPTRPMRGAGAASRRGAAAGPKLILVVFVAALTVDLVGRVSAALLARALRRLVLVPARLPTHGRMTRRGGRLAA
jgi:hypothetical protein